MTEIFNKICRDLPRGFCASKHPLGGISIYYGSRPDDTCIEMMSIREQTKWVQGKWKRTGKYLISQDFSDKYTRIQKDLSFPKTAEITRELFREMEVIR